MKTPTEKRLSQRRRVEAKGGLIVPLLTELLANGVEIESTMDASWLYTLAEKMVQRDKIRKEGYQKNEMVFSPSGLASCMRRVFLSKNHQNYGLRRVELPAVEPHFYFFTGDWLHLKWQFAFYKLSMALDDFFLVDCEIPIMSKRKDHGGTLDVLCVYRGEALIIDVKGLNVRAFNQVDRGPLQHSYRIQLADYMMLFNSALQSGRWKPSPGMLNHLGLKEFPKVRRGILLAENKGGPDINHPAALTESIVDLKSNLPEVRARLEVLRGYEEAEEIPPPECESTKLIEFTGCPFSEFCRKEVKKREQARAKTRSTKELRMAKSTRRNRSR